MTRRAIVPRARIGLVTGVVSVVVLALACGASAAAPVPTVAGLAVTSVRGSLVISSIAGGDRRALTKPPWPREPRADYRPTWSPDGSMVAFARWTPKQLSLMVVGKDGSGLRRVAAIGRRGPMSKHSLYRISWSPDGSRLAYLTRVRGGKYGTEAIYVVALDGSDARRVVLVPYKRANSSLWLFGWTPDRARVLYEVSRGEVTLSSEGVTNLMTTSADGTGTAKIVTEYDIPEASWLPDGSLLYVRNCFLSVSHACELALRTPGSNTSRPLTHFKGFEICCEWDFLDFMQRPSGGEIVYAHGSNIYDLSLTAGTTRLVRALRPPRKHDEPLHDEVSLAGISSDGRVALIEFVDYGGRRDLIHDYRLDLDTGAVTPTHLATTDPDQIYLP